MDNNLCCVLNPKLKCFDCRAQLCTNCSWAGKLNTRTHLRVAGIYVLCRKCLDKAEGFEVDEFILVSTWEGDFQ
jgi:hypothetical protein